MMTKKRLLAFASGIVVLFGVVVAGLATYSAYSWRHTHILTPKQSEDIQIALKGTLAQVMFGGATPESTQVFERTGVDALLAATKQTHGDGLITAYQHDPKMFRRYAELIDTASNAKLVGEAVKSHQTAYRLPMSSAELPLQTSEKLDAWGHPYCVSR